MNNQSKSDQLLTLLNELIPSYEKSANELHDKSVLLTQLAAEAMKEANELRKLVSMLRLTIHDHITQSKVDEITKSVQQHHEAEKVHVFEEVPVAPHQHVPQPHVMVNNPTTFEPVPTPSTLFSQLLTEGKPEMKVSIPNHTHVPDAPNTSSPAKATGHAAFNYEDEVDKEKLLDEFEQGKVTTSVMDLPIDMIETMPNVDFSK